MNTFRQFFFVPVWQLYPIVREHVAVYGTSIVVEKIQRSPSSFALGPPTGVSTPSQVGRLSLFLAIVVYRQVSWWASFCTTQFAGSGASGMLHESLYRESPPSEASN